jgi:hypothetical protein
MFKVIWRLAVTLRKIWSMWLVSFYGYPPALPKNREEWGTRHGEPQARKG